MTTTMNDKPSQWFDVMIRIGGRLRFVGTTNDILGHYGPDSRAWFIRHDDRLTYRAKGGRLIRVPNPMRA